MDFKEAIRLLKDGKQVRRRSWNSPFDYVAYVKDRVNDTSEIRFFFQDAIPFFYPADIVFSNDWQVLGEDQEQLLEFAEAIDRVMKQNAKIKLRSWKNNTWVQLAEDKQSLYMRRMDSKTFNLDFQTMIASDWESTGE